MILFNSQKGEIKMTTENDSKVTANINSDLYNAVSTHFHYGQRAVFFNKLFESLKMLIADNKWNEVVSYMYNGTDLTLPGKE